MTIKHLILAVALSLLPVGPVLADPYSPRLSQKEKARHEFRDVQRGYVPAPPAACRGNVRHGTIPKSPASGTSGRGF